MIRAGMTALLLLAFGGGGDKQPPPAQPRPPVGMITVHQQIIIRVPAGFGSSAPEAGTLVEWRESHGPHCLAAARIVGATFPSSDSVDFVLADNSRVRARLDRHCPALDFYRILYVPATADGQICADRDVVRSRSGAACEIDQFRSLRPRRHR
jgi:hypothetical protein